MPGNGSSFAALGSTCLVLQASPLLFGPVSRKSGWGVIVEDLGMLYLSMGALFAPGRRRLDQEPVPEQSPPA
jgi:hypothetical protein